MPADQSDQPAVHTPEAEPIDFEILDDANSPSGDRDRDGAAEEFAQHLQSAPGMLVGMLRGMLKERLKRWFVRSLIWGGVLGFFATEHTWAKWAFGIWAVIASVHLAFLLYGWHVSGKQGAKIAQIFGGMLPPRERE